MMSKLLRTIFVSLALILPSGTALHEKLSRPRVAVCVAGAVRSLTEEKMQSSLVKFYSGADVFYHLYVGVELSLRGQRKMVDPYTVADALANASGVRLQYEENQYTCGQQTTGKHFKVEQCTRMVFSYAAFKNITYYALILTRPDYMMNSGPKFTLSWMLSFVHGKTNFYHNFGDEVVLLSYPGGALFAANLTQAECCNISHREPLQCFTDNLVEPRPNYIFERHFLRLYEDEKAYHHIKGIGFILRTPEFKVESGGGSVWQLHGKVKPGVVAYQNPGMSPPFLEWNLLEPALQQHLVAHYIHKAYVNHSA